LGDIPKKHWTIGFSHECESKKFAGSTELKYDFSKTLLGIKGYPFEVTWAGNIKLADNINVKSKLHLSNEIMAEAAWVQKVDEHLKVIGSHRYNLTKLIYSPEHYGLGLGIQFQYTL